MKVASITEKNGIPHSGHQPPKKSNTNKVDIKIILLYSAKKNKAKEMPPYSTLYPETSSASASGKSKGARFVSATMDIKKIKNNGKKGIINQKSI